MTKHMASVSDYTTHQQDETINTLTEILDDAWTKFENVREIMETVVKQAYDDGYQTAMSEVADRLEKLERLEAAGVDNWEGANL